MVSGRPFEVKVDSVEFQMAVLRETHRAVAASMTHVSNRHCLFIRVTLLWRILRSIAVWIWD